MRRSGWVKEPEVEPTARASYGAGWVDQVLVTHAGLPKDYIRICFHDRPGEKTLQKLRRSVFMYGYLNGVGCWHAAYTPVARALADLLCSKAENWASVGEHPDSIWDDLSYGEMDFGDH